MPERRRAVLSQTGQRLQVRPAPHPRRATPRRHARLPPADTHDRSTHPMTTPTFKPDNSYRVENGFVSLDHSCSSYENDGAFHIRMTDVAHIDQTAHHQLVQPHPAPARLRVKRPKGAFVFVGNLTYRHPKGDLQTPRQGNATQFRVALISAILEQDKGPVSTNRTSSGEPRTGPTSARSATTITLAKTTEADRTINPV